MISFVATLTLRIVIQTHTSMLLFRMAYLASKETVLLGIQILAISNSREHYDFNNFKNECSTVIMASLINI